MNTYEQGRAPEGAPYTYDRDHLGFVGRVYGPDGAVDDDLTREIETPRVADRVLQAMHVAKLADEMADMLSRAPLTPPGTTDWLCRYREAAR